MAKNGASTVCADCGEPLVHGYFYADVLVCEACDENRREALRPLSGHAPPKRARRIVPEPETR